MGFSFPPPENKVTSIINSIRKEKEQRKGIRPTKPAPIICKKFPFQGTGPLTCHKSRKGELKGIN